MKHYEFMKIAIEEAIEGMKSGHGGPFGAVIVRDGEIIARAHSEVFKNNDPIAHAEVMAIRKAAQKLGHPYLDDGKYTIYSSCEPCPMCLSAIYWSKIDKLYYGCTKEDAKKYGFGDKDIYDILEHKTKPPIEITQVHRMASLEAFRLWASKNKTLLVSNQEKTIAI